MTEYPHHNSALSRVNQLLFLRIFKEVKKKMKSGNQYDVAEKMKAIFHKAYEAGAIGDIDENISTRVYDEKLQQYVIKIVKDEFYHHRILEKESFYKNIGLSQKTIWYLYRDAWPIDLARYLESASPEAIVQMRKRLLKLN